MRLIPGKTKVRMEVFKGVSLADIIVCAVFLSLMVCVMLSELPLRVLMAILLGLIMVLLVIRPGGVSNYTRLLMMLRFFALPGKFERVYDDQMLLDKASGKLHEEVIDGYKEKNESFYQDEGLGVSDEEVELYFWERLMGTDAKEEDFEVDFSDMYEKKESAVFSEDAEASEMQDEENQDGEAKAQEDVAASEGAEASHDVETSDGDKTSEEGESSDTTGSSDESQSEETSEDGKKKPVFKKGLFHSGETPEEKAARKAEKAAAKAEKKANKQK